MKTLISLIFSAALAVAANAQQQVGTIKFTGSSSGTTTVQAQPTATGTVLFPSPGSGITVSLPEGLVPTAVKNSGYTLAPGDLVPADVSGGTVAFLLPNAPADGTRVALKIIAISGSYVATLACQGSDTYNVATTGSTTSTLSLLNQAMTVQYTAATKVWYVINTDIALSQLDLRYNGSFVGTVGSPSSAGGALVLTSSLTTVYVTAASTASTWTLPAAASNTGRAVLFVIVAGGANHVNVYGGAVVLYLGVTALTSGHYIQNAAPSALDYIVAMSDGTNWSCELGTGYTGSWADSASP